MRDSLRKSGLRVVERLQKAGVLGPSTLAAHCVHVDRIETEILLDSGTMVVHNPRSNMNNAVGTADLPWMLKIGIPVGLGNDGFSNNMFTEMATAYLVHKQATGDPRTLPADQVIQMAWEHNARIARAFFPGLGPQFGQLAKGAPADVILVDYDPPTPLTSRQPALAHHLWHRRHRRGHDHRRRTGTDARPQAADAGRDSDHGPRPRAGGQTLAESLSLSQNPLKASRLEGTSAPRQGPKWVQRVSKGTM